MAEEPTSSDSLLTEDQHFQRVLQLFPIVRSRDYCEDDETNVTTTSENEHNLEVQGSFGDPSQQESKGVSQAMETKLEEHDNDDPFWALLNVAAEQKLGCGDAQRFCDAFKKVHRELVYKTLTLEGIELAAKNWDVRTNVST